MKDFSISLDKYYNGEPDCGLDNWFEEVSKKFTDTFFYKNEDWIMEYGGLCEKWLKKLVHKEPQQAAIIIERAFKFYCNK